MHTVHVRVNDAATGKPTPCRIRFTDAEGRYFAPFGRLTEFAAKWGEDVGGNLALGDQRYAYIDGACEISLPDGLLMVEISKGFEYRPVQEQVHLVPAKLALRFTLERWVDLRAEGWYSGDAWATGLTPHAALLEGSAEDLAVVNLLAEDTWQFGPGEDMKTGAWRRAIPNILALSGQEPALQRPDCMVVVNTANRSAHLGELALLNSHRPVYPLSFSYDSGIEVCNWTLADWCDQCHRKGGLVIGRYLKMQELKDDLGSVMSCGELLADLILGKIDALDVPRLGRYGDEPILTEWQAALNAGLRVPLACGSTKRLKRVVLGSPRTYARLQTGQQFSYKNWIEAVRAGRTFVTNGPLLSLTVNGQEPGAVLDLPSSAKCVHIRVEARSIFPLDSLEVICNGTVVAEAEATGSPLQAVIETDVSLAGPAWLAACCTGWHEDPTRGPFGAHSSPVYVQIDGRRIQPDASTAAPLFAWLDTVQQWVAHEARCENDAQRQRLAAVFEAARQELLRRQAP